MVFGSIISSPRASLSLHQALHLANVYLENARKENDPGVALVLCHDTEMSLSQVKRSAKHTQDETMRAEIATIYIELGELLDIQGQRNEAQVFYKKSEKWGGRVLELGRPTHPFRPISLVSSSKGPHFTADTSTDEPLPPSLSPYKQGSTTAKMPRNIFPRNMRPPGIVFNPPEPDTRLNDTRQLACCLGLLKASYELDDILDPAARNWLNATKLEQDEKERLEALASDVIRAFKRDEIKDGKSVTEVVFLAPVLDSDDFRYLVKEFYTGIEQSALLDVHQLEGLAQLIQGADPGYLDSDDLVKVLVLLSTRLRETHQQSTAHLYRLTIAVSHVLDAMADANVKGLNREKIHEPLSSYLDELKGSPDPYLVYQAAYAYQALLCVPDDESLWQGALRRTGKVIQSVSGLVSSVKSLDLYRFLEELGNIQKGLAEATEIARVVKAGYDGAVSLTEGGRGFFYCLKENLNFSRKCAWYTALRGADILIGDGQFVEFRKLVCEAPCRHDPAFLWGVCQRLGEIAANSMWDTETRQSAIEFIVEIYRNDAAWGDQANVKQWIVSILMQLSSMPGSEMQFAETQLQGLEKCGDAKMQALYRACHDKGPGLHPLKVGLPEIGSPSLLDRVQERPLVEGSLRQLRRQRLKRRGSVVYIPPQAKASLQARDEARFPLMEKVDEFLASDQMVFLLLGDSGAGKSTFNREFECHLWQSYKKTGAIPLYINLPAIDKPEYDIIAKQLRKNEFTEPQIRELKLHRKFILICDGYDESQQTHNLYTRNRLNQPGEWKAKMVISCRSEYLGVDYRDRFQPGDRNRQSDSVLFQEAVIAPFSMSQVQDYITQYVSVYRPLWEIDDYKNALDLIPSLKELVKNPFLMSLSLEVMPRMIDSGQDLSTTHITRTALYDQFIEHWLERGKKRLGEKNLTSQARAAFEGLIDEGFTRNGIDYLKKLSIAIYREQGGQPIVSYSRYKDENTWKASFFSRDEEKQLLREACPLIRNGNQHRFIHRSLLEYGVALAIFDPQDLKERIVSESSSVLRTSTLSVVGSNGHDLAEEAVIIERGHDLDSPLAWRSFMNEPSVLQFLEERVQQEPMFKRLLLEYLEHSKHDRKWRIAAANAITVLVRAGVQFIGADLRGIQVPSADLSFGMFDSAHFQEADLSNVDFRGAWLREANMSQAQMTGVQFGELPFLEQDSAVTVCVYSPDGMTITVGCNSGKMCVYSTLSWERLWMLEGHRDSVKSIVYSLSSDRIASSGVDRTVRLWNILTGVCIHVMNGHDDWIWNVAYSPQEDQVVSVSSDMTMKLWDVETGDCRHIWIGHTGDVVDVLYSPKGNQIASSGCDCTIRLWDTQSGKCRHVLRGHENVVQSLAYSPQGDKVASASYDHTVRLWNVSTGACHHTFSGHTGLVNSVVYSPNGDQVASCSADGSVRLWDINTGMCLHTLLGHNDSATKVVYSPKGELVASAGNDKTVRVWDSETGACRRTLTGHSSTILSVVFSPKGDQIASGSPDKTVRLWDVGGGTSQHISSGHASSVRMVKCSPKGDRIASCSDDGTVRLWNIETGVCSQVLRGDRNTASCLAYSPQGNQIATGSYNGIVRLWNAETGECSHTLGGHSEEVNDIVYSPHKDMFVSSSRDRTVRLWDAKSGACRHTLTEHDWVVSGVVILPNGSQVVSRSWDRTVRIWDAETGACNHNLIGHNMSVRDIAHSPQGEQLASVSQDTTVRVWDVATGECCLILIGHNVPVHSIAYSPRGGQVTSGGEGGSLRVWDLEARTCLWILVGHNDAVNRIVYSSRDLVVSASNDKSVRIWDVTSGQCRAMIQGLQGCVNDVAWIKASSVNYLVIGCSDGMVGMWKVKVDKEGCHTSLHWVTTKGELTVKVATIQDVQGLSQLNKQLLIQRGAIGEPIDRLREASKKLTTMASVASKFKTLSDRVVEEPVFKNNTLVKELEQKFWQAKELDQKAQQARDSFFQDMMAAVVKNIPRSE